MHHGPRGTTAHHAAAAAIAGAPRCRGVQVESNLKPMALKGDVLSNEVENTKRAFNTRGQAVMFNLAPPPCRVDGSPALMENPPRGTAPNPVPMSPHTDRARDETPRRPLQAVDAAVDAATCGDALLCCENPHAGPPSADAGPVGTAVVLIPAKVEVAIKHKS